jgi:hypothetical protein
MIAPQKPDRLAAKLKTRFLSEGFKRRKVRSLPAIFVSDQDRVSPRMPIINDS